MGHKNGAGKIGTTESDRTMLFDPVPDTPASATAPRCTPCFTPGTLITTQRGELPVQLISAGDRVVTRDNGIQTCLLYTSPSPRD